MSIPSIKRTLYDSEEERDPLPRARTTGEEGAQTGPHDNSMLIVSMSTSRTKMAQLQALLWCKRIEIDTACAER